eukprot:scaffold150602_cov35-Tisochrysis_lutea.AAC.5
MTVRVSPAYVSRAVAQVRAERNQHEVLEEEHDRNGGATFGDEVARAMPCLEAGVLVCHVDLYTVIRRHDGRPQDESNHVKEHERADKLQELGKGYSHLTHARIHHYHRHTPQLRHKRPVHQRGAKVIKPDLSTASNIKNRKSSRYTEGNRLHGVESLVVQHRQTERGKVEDATACHEDEERGLSCLHCRR